MLGLFLSYFLRGEVGRRKVLICIVNTSFLRTGEIGANGKPAVACEVCGKKLADPSSLYRHRKIHSGDKPHKCPYCPR